MELVRKHSFLEEFLTAVEVEDYLPLQTERVPNLFDSDVDDDVSVVQRTISELWKETDGLDVGSDSSGHLVRMKIE